METKKMPTDLEVLGPQTSIPTAIKPAVDMDDFQLQNQGHKSEMPRRFSFLNLLSFSFSIMNSWVAFVSLLLTSVSAGGAPAAFWATFVSVSGMAILTLGVAELASAYPCSGGPYHFAYMTAPRSIRAPVAFMTGAVNTLAYILFVASSLNFFTSVLLGLVSIHHPLYAPEQWHIYLVSIALLVLVSVSVTLVPSAVPRTQTMFFLASLIGMVVVMITVLARSTTKASAKSVFVDYENGSGWSNGFSFLLVAGQSNWLFASVDGATHLAEEVPQPTKYVPLAMMLSIVIGFLTTLGFSMALLFSCDDFAAISTAKVAYHEAIRQGVGSTALATFFTAWVLFIYFGAAQAAFATCGRLIWAFARDNGMPYSNHLSKVNHKLGVPVNAHIAAAVAVAVISVIAVGSTVALNNFIAGSIVFVLFSATMPQIFVLGKGRARLPPRRWDLGNIIGPFCNIFSILWSIFFITMLCFPIYLPIDAQNMNYVSIVFIGGLTVFGLVYIQKRKTFRGPEIPQDVLDGVAVEQKH